MIDFMILIQMKGRPVYPNSDGPGAAYIFLPGSGTAKNVDVNWGKRRHKNVKLEQKRCKE